MGVSYPLLPIRLPEKCIIPLYANSPLNLSEKLPQCQDVSWLVSFTNETEAERQHILSHFAALRQGKTPGSKGPEKGNLGRFMDGVL